MRASIAVTFAACVAASALPAAGRTLAVADIRRIVEVEQPAISPDGTRVAYVTIASEWARNAYVRALHLIDVRDGRDAVLVRDADVTLPRWSPNGALAYLDRSDGRIAVMRWEGRPVTFARAEGDANDFAWGPGGSILFSAYDAPAQRDYFEAGDNDYTLTAPIPPVHLWMASAAGAARRLTHGSWTVAPTDATGMFASSFTWSPDGKTIVFARLPNTFTGDDENSALYALDVTSGAMRPLTGRSSVEWAPAFSPDGSRLSYSYAKDGNFLAQTTLRLHRGDADAALTPASFDRDLGGAAWMPGGQSLLACGNDETHSRAYLVSPDALPRTLDLGGLEITCDAYQSSTFDAGIDASVARDGAIAFVATGARRLRELYYLPRVGARPRRLTNVNGFLDAVALGKIEPIAWTGADGYREFGVVHYPPGAVAGKKYPIVVLVHGGPGLSEIESVAGKSYGGDWPIEQLIAARGYVVFAPNYRGSDDAGNRFLLAIVGDTVAGPSADILGGLQAVKALPQADGSRVGVCGWSYGGLLTSWLIGQGGEWKAAVSGAAVDVESQSYDLSVSNVQDRYYQGGATPYVGDGAKRYADVSPITYASSVKAPTLIWGTTRDPVVPITMSYAFYHALRDNHVPVKFVVFDAPTHGPDTPRNTAELTALWLGWLDKYL